MKGKWSTAVRFVVTSLVALAIGAVVILISRQSPLEAYSLLFKGAFGSREGLADTLLCATPLILTGLATGIAFRAGVFNVGVEGSLYLGAFGAAWVGFTFTSMPGWLLILFAVVISALAGGVWSLVPASLKVRLGVDEVVSTIMLNYVAILFTSYLVNYPFLPPGVANSMSAPIAPQARLARLLPPSQLNTSFLWALLAAVIVAWTYRKTTLGYEMRMVGSNSAFARASGINVGAVIYRSMWISGLLGGLAGAAQILGVNYRFIDGFSPGYGFDGMTVALLAKNDPVGIVAGALLFGALRNGGSTIQLFSSIPISLVDILQAVVVLLATAEVVLPRLRYRKRVETYELHY